MKKITLLFAFLSISTNAQNYTKLHDFDDINGVAPTSMLISDGTYLYGTTSGGGGSNFGAIFKIKPDGTSFSIVHNFDSINGAWSVGSLMYDGIYLYGTTSGGGTSDRGVIFKIKPDGTGFVKLHDFTDVALIPPNTVFACYGGRLVSDGTYLYGTTLYGGLYGTIFKIKLDGTGFINIYTFTMQFPSGNMTNGAFPLGNLIYDGIYLYGVASYAGIYGSGVIFKIKTDGTGFTKLHDFNAPGEQNAVGGLVSDGTYLYGSTRGKIDTIIYNRGTIFKIKPDGTEFSRIYQFSGGMYGAGSMGRLITEGGYLYGTEFTIGGAHDKGAVYRIKPDGTNHAVLYTFNGTDGEYPNSSLYGFDGSLYSDGSFLYGTTMYGGATSNFGVIYKLVGSCMNLPEVGIICNATNICTGEPVTLSGGGAITYTWSTEEVGVSIATSPTVNTVYAVTATDNLGCVNTNSLMINVYACTGIEEVKNEKSEVKSYPNPANNEIYFDVANERDFDVEIYNTLGQLVLSKNNYTNRSAINISALNKNLYFYKIKRPKNSYTGKFVKE